LASETSKLSNIKLKCHIYFSLEKKFAINLDTTFPYIFSPRKVELSKLFVASLSSSNEYDRHGGRSSLPNFAASETYPEISNQKTKLQSIFMSFDDK
jgi:hypothetical protein